MVGELIKIELGKSVIELAPHMSVIDVVAVRVSVAKTVTLRLRSTVRESFIITVTERLFSIVSFLVAPDRQGLVVADFAGLVVLDDGFEILFGMETNQFGPLLVLEHEFIVAIVALR